MSTENPNIFLKNNFFLQFFIADRYRIYRHITACGLLLLFFLTTKEWGAYKGIFDHLDWIERWLVCFQSCGRTLCFSGAYLLPKQRNMERVHH